MKSSCVRTEEWALFRESQDETKKQKDQADGIHQHLSTAFQNDLTKLKWCIESLTGFKLLKEQPFSHCFCISVQFIKLLSWGTLLQYFVEF